LLDLGHEVDLILTDLQMPVMGGRQLAERIRERSASPPVIFMTGYSEDSHGLRADPGLMLLPKPFTPDRLIEFVINALSASRP
jgi:CheY-like chemotaxis protein